MAVLRGVAVAVALLVAAHAAPTPPSPSPEGAGDAEAEQMRRWAAAVAEGAREPDGWWLKTCAGWSALMLCGAVFGAEIEEATARSEDVGLLFGSAATSTVDYERRAVDTQCAWNFTETVPYTAIFREGVGCTLVEGLTEAELRAQDTGDQAPPPPLDPEVPWPVGEAGPTDAVPPGVDMQCIRERVAEQFADTGANPRAITVVYLEQLIFEQYQAGVVDKNSRLIGWSATKSVVNALIGVLAGEGRIEVFDRAPVAEWQGDDRAQITTDEMLHMTSGTPWGFDPLTTTWCLFDSDGDCAHFCTDPDSFPLDTPPGARYEYNSGSSYILSRIVNQERGDPELSASPVSSRALALIADVAGCLRVRSELRVAAAPAVQPHRGPLLLHRVPAQPALPRRSDGLRHGAVRQSPPPPTARRPG